MSGQLIDTAIYRAELFVESLTEQVNALCDSVCQSVDDRDRRNEVRMRFQSLVTDTRGELQRFKNELAELVTIAPAGLGGGDANDTLTQQDPEQC